MFLTLKMFENIKKESPLFEYKFSKSGVYQSFLH